MKWDINTFKKNFSITDSQIQSFYLLNETSKEFRNQSKHGDVFLFEVKIKVNHKYKETFYINALQVGMKTVDLIFYTSYEEAFNDIDSIIEETIQGTLF